MSNYTETIGIGPLFPITLDQEGKWGTVSGDISLIISDLKSAMAHSLGEMIRQENLGHRLFELLEEPNTGILSHLAKKFIIEYINSIEFRIIPLDYKDITVATKQSSINIVVKAFLKTGEEIEPINLSITKI